MRWRGGGGSQTPAAAGAATAGGGGPREHEWICAGLWEMLSASPARPCRGLVDLGPVSSRSLEVYSRVTSSIRFVDVLAGASGGATAAGFVPPAAAMGVLERLAAGSQSLALCWEVLDYLTPGSTAVLVASLARCLERGARLHMLVTTSGRIPARPRRLELGSDGRVRVTETVDEGWIGRGDLAPAEVERRLRPFVVEHSVLLRDGIREVVAAHRQGG